MSTYYETSYPPSLWDGGTSSTVVSVNPNTAAVGAAPLLTVNGTGFTAGSVVSFDGDPRPTTFVGATQLTATVATIAGVARTVQVTVSTGGSRPFTITATGVQQAPWDFTIPDVQAFCNANPELADEVLALEMSRGSQARVTLVNWLQNFLATRAPDTPADTPVSPQDGPEAPGGT